MLKIIKVLGITCLVILVLFLWLIFSLSAQPFCTAFACTINYNSYIYGII